MLTSSHAYVPLSKEAQNASGLPWSVAVDLLVQPPAPALRPAASIERCQHCFAYINKFCTFERKQWRVRLLRVAMSPLMTCLVLIVWGLQLSEPAIRGSCR